MKPRLVYRHLVWSCATDDWMQTGRMGFGYTPKEAYDDWRKQHV